MALEELTIYNFTPDEIWMEQFVVAVCRSKKTESNRVILGGLADNLSKAGWSWGCVSAIDSNGRTIWIADAHRDEGKRFVVRADEKFTAFLELERAICLHLLE